MIQGYSIPGIPTPYHGTLYRSRTEARWAAFFDLLSWHYEYEPVDLGSWSPDFALWGRCRSHLTYVEVKPIHDWNRAIARKMANACRDCGDLPVDRILLLPQWPNQIALERPVRLIQQIGWIGEVGSNGTTWEPALLHLDREQRFDLLPLSEPEGLFWKETRGEPALNQVAQIIVADKWAAARNLVQYLGERAEP